MCRRGFVITSFNGIDRPSKQDAVLTSMQQDDGDDEQNEGRYAHEDDEGPRDALLQAVTQVA